MFHKIFDRLGPFIYTSDSIPLVLRSQQKLYQLRRTLKAAEDDASVLDNLEEVYIEVWELSKMINDKFQISIGVVLLQQ